MDPPGPTLLPIWKFNFLTSQIYFYIRGGRLGENLVNNPLLTHKTISVKQKSDRAGRFDSEVMVGLLLDCLNGIQEQFCVSCFYVVLIIYMSLVFDNFHLNISLAVYRIILDLWSEWVKMRERRRARLRVDFFEGWHRYRYVRLIFLIPRTALPCSLVRVEHRQWIKNLQGAFACYTWEAC